MNAANPSPILIYDTTLRDGTQGENVSFSVSGKLRIAEKLDQFGIDYIEGGWPGSNPRDMAFFEAARELRLKHARIAAFGSTRRAGLKAQEDPQLALLIEAQTPVVTIFGKTWLLHVTEVLRTTPEENLRMIEDSVRFLKSRKKEVFYDAEHFFDGYKDNREYALSTLEAALRGGADNLSLCDTNGGCLVKEVEAITGDVVERFGPKASIGVHCHNDTGLGVAVSLAGIEAGATLVQGTLNGYGERNGNANLTTILPALTLKMGRTGNYGDHLPKLRDLSLFVDDMANLRPDTRAPFVGASAFAHKGGVHANAAAKISRSYEHIEPEKVGNRRRILVSDMSGRASILMKAKELGVSLEKREGELKSFLEELKGLEYRGYEYEAADASFELLIDKWLEKKQEFFELVSYRVITEHREGSNRLVSSATVKVRVNGQLMHTVADSHGPVGALDAALRKALEASYPEVAPIRLTDYKVRILDSGLGAEARIRVQIESTDGESIWGTVGASDNVIEASWEALKDAVEFRLHRELRGRAPAIGVAVESGAPTDSSGTD